MTCIFRPSLNAIKSCIKSHCRRSVATSTKLYSVNQQVQTGEWIVDYNPNITWCLKQRHKLVDSLQKRIHVHQQQDAEDIIENLRARNERYEACLERLGSLTAQFDRARIAQDLSRLEFLDLKKSLRSAYDDCHATYEALVAVWKTIPNVLVDVEESDLSTLVTDYERNSTLSQLMTQLDGGDSITSKHSVCYLTGRSALFELELQDYAASVLNDNNFLEVTVPYMVRSAVIDRLEQVDINEECYTLQTKSELHAEADDPGSYRPETQRAAKPEDDYVYRLCGVTEMTLMVTHIRQYLCKRFGCVKSYATGNRYRLPYTGRPQQSKVLTFTVADETEDSCQSSFYSHLLMFHQFWSGLGLDVRHRVVRPHLLRQHECAAVEFLVNVGGRYVDVGSRISMSGDFISRRIMSFKSLNKNEMLHFTSGDLVDISWFIERLQKKT